MSAPSPASVHAAEPFPYPFWKATPPMPDTRTYVALVTETRNASGDFHVTVTPDTHPGITVTPNTHPGVRPDPQHHPRARRVSLPDSGALALLDTDGVLVAAYADGQWAEVRRTGAPS